MVASSRLSSLTASMPECPPERPRFAQDIGLNDIGLNDIGSHLGNEDRKPSCNAQNRPRRDFAENITQQASITITQLYAGNSPYLRHLIRAAHGLSHLR